ncbi:MAG: hypothetical protein E2O68_05305 [Deltaproteobacteria bacterium]|nr:MAG: hypothetical protein E2O68_05305 [Deltaproteobacteria bacterium]
MKLYKLLPILALLINTFALAQESEELRSTYGTSAVQARSYSSNHENAVKKSLPRFSNRVLKRKLEGIQKKYPNGLTSLKVKNLNMLQKVFKVPRIELRPGQSYFEAKDNTYAYELIPREGKLYFYKNLDGERALPPRQAEAQLAQVKKEHQVLMRELGINPNEVFFQRTNFMMIRSSTKPDENGRSKNKAPLVDAFLTYGLRSLEGLMVEGSYVKLLSKGAGKLETTKIKWPDFKFHPSIKDFNLKDKKSLSEEILREIKNTFKEKERINVKMAVVLRNVEYRKQRVYIPSIRVGVYPSSGEAGNMFYADLLKQAVPFKNEARNDSRGSRENR